MPKIISNSIISSSDNRDDPQGLHSYYCLCSEFILVIDMELGQLPRRETDNAIILANATRIGENLFEKQYRMYCPRCNLLIAYETTPHLKGGPYTYIIQGALNEVQGVPHDDWELDLPGGNEAGKGSIKKDDQDGTQEHGYGHDYDLEMKIRMEGNQSAAASARAFLAASGSKR
ncbi:hypothetical protein BGZ51_007140 [Haplosporangium sp. Z 767]|nr:hypothetical protein BGZ51_007140 [Haplosporangium sp. Z 767]KAF9192589.1 hypothetical protein BGZ50_008420 [Haplosporangium sp. Z 11]